MDLKDSVTRFIPELFARTGGNVRHPSVVGGMGTPDLLSNPSHLSGPEARAAYQRLGSKLCPLQLRHTYRHKRTVTEGLARKEEQEQIGLCPTSLLWRAATCRVILPGGRDLQLIWLTPNKPPCRVATVEPVCRGGSV